MTALAFLLGSMGALLVIACHHALARRLDSRNRIQRRLHASAQRATATTIKVTTNPHTNISTRIPNPLGVAG